MSLAEIFVCAYLKNKNIQHAIHIPRVRGGLVQQALIYYAAICALEKETQEHIIHTDSMQHIIHLLGVAQSPFSKQSNFAAFD
jgi:hypothetical protein